MSQQSSQSARRRENWRKKKIWRNLKVTALWRVRRTEGRKTKSKRERVYSAHSSARSIGECLGKRTWTTHTVPRDHRASPLAYIRLHGSPKTIPWPFSTDRPVALDAGPAVRYFDTVDTRLISIRYGRRERNCRAPRLFFSFFFLTLTRSALDFRLPAPSRTSERWNFRRSR